MPSPFPGMDPYLEDPALWPDLHHRLITVSSDLLAEALRPKYFVRIEERVYVSDENDPGRRVIIPDLRIAPRPYTSGRPWEPSGGGAVVAEPVVAFTMTDDQIRDPYLEIVDRDGRQVVTVLEFLGPANKVVGSKSERSFKLKRAEVMGSTSHWVEIDLLREGERIWTRDRLPPCEYLVHVSRADKRPQGFVWPIRLSQRLPVIPIPLKAGDADAPLDIQAVLNTAYDRAHYDLSVDYGRAPTSPFEGEWGGWARDVIGGRRA